VKIAVLSTPTKHHTYFINCLAEHADIVGIFYERRRITKPFPIGPFFAAEEDAFENRFFDSAHGGTAPTLPETLSRRVVEVDDVNQPGVAEHLAALAPDLVVVFGTGRLGQRVLAVPRWGCINVHRGLTQYHRGLDSDLWAIHQGRLDQIGVTIHYVDADLDTGDILAQETVAIGPSTEIFHLRFLTSVVATRLVIDVVGRIRAARTRIPGRPQNERGRYFSAMPLATKHEALQRFLALRPSGERAA